MHLYDSELYMQDVCAVASMIEVQELADASVLISGGTGMIGSFLVDALLYADKHYQANTQVYILGRNEEKARARFADYADCPQFHFIKQDINEKVVGNPALPAKIDYVIHAASNTHPVAYASDPIGTITANVFGTQYLLDYAKEADCKRLYFYLRLKSTEKTVEIPINSQRTILAISTATRCVPDIRRANVPERHCVRHTVSKWRWML